MVLVRVGQQRHVDMAVPGRDTLVEAAHEQIRIGSAIDEQAPAIGGLEQDGIALADIEDTQRQRGTWPGHQRHRRGQDQDAGEERGRQPAPMRRGVPRPSQAREWVTRSRPSACDPQRSR